MWIPPIDPTKEDEDRDVIEDPRLLQEFIKKWKSSPNYLPPEQQKLVAAERARDLDRRLQEFRASVEKLGIVFTRRGLDEILSNQENRRKYKIVLPLILQFLPKYADPLWRSTFKNLLGTPLSGKQGAHALIQEFVEAEDKWESGSLLELNGDSSVSPELIQILENPEYGMARQRVIVALAKTRDPRTFDVISKLVNDPELTGHAIQAFDVLRDPRAIPLIEPHLSHKMPWIRKAAARALKHLQPSSSVQ